MIRTIEWANGKVKMIDQTKLPQCEEVFECMDYLEVAKAIKDMKIRGAPAIGIAAAFGVALGVKNSSAKTRQDLLKEVEQICQTLLETRPTAVNLSWALERMMRKAESSRTLSIEEAKKVLLKGRRSSTDETNSNISGPPNAPWKAGRGCSDASKRASRAFASSRAITRNVRRCRLFRKSINAC